MQAVLKRTHLLAATSLLAMATVAVGPADAAEGISGRFNVDAVQIRYQPTSNSTLIGRGANQQFTCSYYQAQGENINGTNIWLYSGNYNRVGWSPSNRINLNPGSKCVDV